MISPARSFHRLSVPDRIWVGLFLALTGGLCVRYQLLGLPALGEIAVGALRLSPFGLLVATDFVFGFYLVRRWCVGFGLDWTRFAGAVVWVAGLGFYAAHLLAVLLYFPERAMELGFLLDPRLAISSFGGLIGGTVVAVIVCRRRGLSFLRYGDALAYGFVGGYAFGRLGCFSIHDHRGTETASFLGVPMDGVRRHDLGFYEVLLMVALLVGIHGLSRRGRPRDGAVMAFSAVGYGSVRLMLDFLRIDDATYLGLTPAQWLSVPLVGCGVWLWWRAETRGGGAGRDV